MAGLPVVISDFPEMAKIVKKYELGEIFNPEEPQDISRTINSSLSDPDKHKRYKENTKKLFRFITGEMKRRSYCKFTKNCWSNENLLVFLHKKETNKLNYLAWKVYSY